MRYVVHGVRVWRNIFYQKGFFMKKYIELMVGERDEVGDAHEKITVAFDVLPPEPDVGINYNQVENIEIVCKNGVDIDGAWLRDLAWGNLSESDRDLVYDMCNDVAIGC